MHYGLQFTLQLSLACFAEYVLHLTRLNPDMMYVHQDSGLINIAYFKFDVDDTSGELDANRPVPFRLTPNILEFLTSTGSYQFTLLPFICVLIIKYWIILQMIVIYEQVSLDP